MTAALRQCPSCRASVGATDPSCRACGRALSGAAAPGPAANRRARPRGIAILVAVIAITLVGTALVVFRPGAETPPGATTITGRVRLPDGGSLRPDELHVRVFDADADVDSSGRFRLVTAAARDAAPLIMATTADDRPVLLAYLPDRDPVAVELSAESTAIALAMNGPASLRLSDEQRRAVLVSVAGHPDLADLVLGMERIIVAGGDAFASEGATGIFDLALRIGQEALAGVEPEPDLDLAGAAGPSRLAALTTGAATIGMPGIDAATALDRARYIAIEDDSRHSLPTVTIVNRTFAWYWVKVFRDGAQVPAAGNGELVPRVRAHTPVVNLATGGSFAYESRKDVSPGDGTLTFEFRPDPGLTFIESLATAASGVMGLHANIEPQAVTACLLSAGGEALDLYYDVTTMVTRYRASSDWTQAELVADVRLALAQHAATGLMAVGDCLETNLAAAQGRGWAASWARLCASKPFIAAFATYYAAELALALYAAITAPTGSETGLQAGGRYPAVSVSIAPDPVESKVGELVSLSATIDTGGRALRAPLRWEWHFYEGGADVIDTGPTPAVHYRYRSFHAGWRVAAFVYDADGLLVGRGEAPVKVAPANSTLRISPVGVTVPRNTPATWTATMDNPPASVRYWWSSYALGESALPAETAAPVFQRTFQSRGVRQMIVRALDVSDPARPVVVAQATTWFTVVDAPPSPAPSPVASASRPGQATASPAVAPGGVGAWRFVETINNAADQDLMAPFNQTNKWTPTFGENTMSGAYTSMGSSPPYATYGSCSWTWTSSGGLAELRPDDVVTLHLEATYKGIDPRMLTNGLNARALWDAAGVMGSGDHSSGSGIGSLQILSPATSGSISPDPTFTIKAGTGAGVRMALEVNCGPHGAPRSMTVQRVYEWTVPAS